MPVSLDVVLTREGRRLPHPRLALAETGQTVATFAYAGMPGETLLRDEQIEAYMRLFAAAPEMLEALREAEVMLREQRIGDRGRAARAAIAKAEGRS